MSSSQDFWTIFGKAGPPNLVLSSPGGLLGIEEGNSVNYVDPIVSGTITSEPGTLVMFGSGVVGLAALLRCKLYM